MKTSLEKKMEFAKHGYFEIIKYIFKNSMFFYLKCYRPQKYYVPKI